MEFPRRIFADPYHHHRHEFTRSRRSLPSTSDAILPCFRIQEAPFHLRRFGNTLILCQGRAPAPAPPRPQFQWVHPVPVQVPGLAPRPIPTPINQVPTHLNFMQPQAQAQAQPDQQPPPQWVPPPPGLAPHPANIPTPNHQVPTYLNLMEQPDHLHPVHVDHATLNDQFTILPHHLPLLVYGHTGQDLQAPPGAGGQGVYEGPVPNPTQIEVAASPIVPKDHASFDLNQPLTRVNNTAGGGGGGGTDDVAEKNTLSEGEAARASGKRLEENKRDDTFGSDQKKRKKEGDDSTECKATVEVLPSSSSSSIKRLKRSLSI